MSPVDIQILGWVIARLPDTKQRRISKGLFATLGGVEMLFEHYLRQTLAAEPRLRDASIKILIALLDMNLDTRAGGLTTKEILKKLDNSFSRKEILTAIDWLVRPDIRLLTMVSEGRRMAYQIVHERLIPAVKKVAFGFPNQSEKINALLKRRVREWLDNGRSKRYLLTWSECLITSQRLLLQWGEDLQQKQEYMRRNDLKWRHRIAFGASIPILFLLLL